MKMNWLSISFVQGEQKMFMDKQFRRFFCEVVCRPVMVIAALLVIIILHHFGYYGFYLHYFKSYSFRVALSIHFLIWYIMLPALILMSLLKVNWIKMHYMIILLITCAVLWWGGSQFVVLRLMLSFYWLTGSMLLLILKFFCFTRILLFFKAI